MTNHSYFEGIANSPAERIKLISDYLAENELVINVRECRNIKIYGHQSFGVYNFIDQTDQETILGRYNPDITGFGFVFKEPPKLKRENAIVDNPEDMNMDVNDIGMYIIYADEDGNLKFKCSKVTNFAEYASKHISIFATCDFGSQMAFAGEITMNERGDYRINPYSGSFMATWINTVLENDTVENDIVTTIKSILKGDDQAISSWLSKQFKKRFEYVNLQFSRNNKMSFTTLLDDIYNRPRVILLDQVDKPFSNHFHVEYALNTLQVYKNRSIYNPIVQKVTRVCKEKPMNILTKALPNIFSNQYPRTDVRFGNMVAYFVPTVDDVKRAKVALDTFNWKVVPDTLPWKEITLRDYSENFDFYDLVGKSFVLTQVKLVKAEKTNESIFKNIDTEFTVESKFPASMNSVYKVMVDKKPMVMKVLSAYRENYFLDYGILTKFRQNGVQKLEDWMVFALPKFSALCWLVPYLGETVQDIPYERRIHLWDIFKQQYVRAIFNNLTVYNDIKPDNTTWDGQQFHLIDFDAFQSRNEWYGPTPSRTFFNKVFAMLLVLNWFKSGMNPIMEYSLLTEKEKLDWAKNTKKDAEIQSLFDILLNENKTKQEQANEILMAVGIQENFNIPQNLE
jgi:hypothetical protein